MDEYTVAVKWRQKLALWQLATSNKIVQSTLTMKQTYVYSTYKITALHTQTINIIISFTNFTNLLFFKLSIIHLTRTFKQKTKGKRLINRINHK